MRMKNHLSVKRAFYILLLITFAVIVASAAIGAEQDKGFLKERANLDRAEKYLNEGELDDAAVILADLAARRPDSYFTQWYYGQCLAWQGEYGKAVEHFKKAQELYPLIVKDFSFTFQMGESLYNIKEYEEAAKYLQVARLLKAEKSDKDKAKKLLANIDKQNK